MEIITAILSAAKAAGVSGVLLLGICNHESSGFKFNYNPMDVDSPSFGVCQLKYNTSLMLNFRGLPTDLMKPKVNARIAAQYLRYQQNRYGNDWVRITAAYNSGSYNPSDRVLGCPRNLKYIRSVQSKLPREFQKRLDCGTFREFAGNP
jgi:soluble lytic murein transglycosylase-like protein